MTRPIENPTFASVLIFWTTLEDFSEEAFVAIGGIRVVENWEGVMLLAAVIEVGVDRMKELVDSTKGVASEDGMVEAVPSKGMKVNVEIDPPD